MIAIAPSILAADFSRLGEQVRETERAGADRVHVDVMDGHFVPNLSMGAAVVKGLRPVTRLPLEIHLMVEGIHCAACVWLIDGRALAMESLPGTLPSAASGTITLTVPGTSESSSRRLRPVTTIGDLSTGGTVT